jgi:VIT1/CCC1 family predicted Fe2+/Mn2+ transporter
MRTFKPEVFLDNVDRMNRKMESVMTILTPAALLSIAPVLFFSYNEQPRTFYLTLTGPALFIVALLVTMLVEVPIVKQIVTWTGSFGRIMGANERVWAPRQK